MFTRIDTALRSGRHISADDFEQHSALVEYHNELEIFYGCDQLELINAPEGFFYLRPRPSADIGTTVLSELDMLVGKVLHYLYLTEPGSPRLGRGVRHGRAARRGVEPG